MQNVSSEVHGALCEVLYRVAIHVRAYCDLDRKLLFALMDAIHNVPLFLQTGDRALGEQVQWDIDHFDERFSEANGSVRLREIYDAYLEGP